MNNPHPPTIITVSTVVEVPIDHAFDVFTQRFDDVKPREHTLLESPIEKSVLEPHLGGAVYDVAIDGSTCTWGRVIAFDPPHSLTISWNITPQWKLESDPDKASEVEIRFASETPTRTRVEIEHKHLDRHGEGWNTFTNLEKENGWPLYLQRFATTAKSQIA